MKTKILSIILAVVMVVALLPLSASATSTYTVSDDFNYGDADALAEVWKGAQANYRNGVSEIAIVADARVDIFDTRSVLIAPQGKVRQSHYVTPISWPTDKLQKFTTVFYYDAENTLSLTQNPSIYVMRIDEYSGLSLIMEDDGTNIHLQWQEYYKNGANCASKTADAVKYTQGILLNKWTTVTVNYDYSVEGKVAVSGTVYDGINTVEMTSYTINFAADSTFTAGYGSYAISGGKHALVYFDSATFEFEGQGEPVVTPEDLAAEYENSYAPTFEITVITNDIELEAVENAIAAYKVLDPAVQAFVTVDIAKYEGLVADYIAAKEAAAAAKEAADAYMLANEAALALETINSPAEYDAVVAAIAAYADLDVAAQALIDDAIIEKLNALKADYDEFLAADYTPVIKGATIKRSGTQTLAFRCAVGAVNARKQVVDCGIIVTASSYIADGYVNSEDLVVDSTNDLVIVAPLEGATNITSGYEFTVNIGNIASRDFGVRYIAKVFVKYSDGTIEYSETATKSVISVAKAISTWVFKNYDKMDDEYGVGDIAEIISNVAEDGTITYAYDVTTDNGVKILEYLEANNEAIATAYNALNVQ